MNNLFTLSVLFFPILAALFVFASSGNLSKKIALVAGLVQFLLSLVLLAKYQELGPLLLEFKMSWIGSLGVNFHVGIDGAGIIMVLLASFLLPIILLSTYQKEIKNANAFYGLILLMTSAMIGVFMAYDLILFYVFWEAALIPIYFIAGYWGGEDRAKVTFKFFIYTILGSLFMLVAIIYVYVQTAGNRSFDYTAIQHLHLTMQEQTWLFWAFFLAFAIKLPIFPFHTWQPTTYATAPSSGSALLSGVMLKMGVFGILRWLYPISKSVFSSNADIAVVLAAIGVVYGAVLALKQDDFKKLIAYSSISHVGLIAVGLFVANELTLQGVLLQSFAHGINVVGLFIIAEIIESRTGTRKISELGGIASKSPRLAILFLIILLGSVALPLTNGFPGEFLLLSGTFGFNPILAATVGLSVILGAVYSLRAYQHVILGETNAITEKFTELKTSEFISLVAICIAVIAFGVYPQFLVDLSSEDVSGFVKLISSTSICVK